MIMQMHLNNYENNSHVKIKEIKIFFDYEVKALKTLHT